MQLGMLGLGRIGGNMVRRLMKGGHSCVVYDRDASSIERLAGDGADGAQSLDEFCAKLNVPRVAWVMVPAGSATEETVIELAERMKPDDIVIDGGNSYYKDHVRRATALHGAGNHNVDVGTSGGVWGRERGYCLMLGGEKKIIEYLDPIWRTLAPG